MKMNLMSVLILLVGAYLIYTQFKPAPTLPNNGLNPAAGGGL